MRAVQVLTLSGPSDVALTDTVPEPTFDPASDAVLIDVHAAGVAFPDLLMTRGLYQIRPTLPFVLGSECAGVVAAAGAASGFSPGERVAASAFGAFAERLVASGGRVIRLPEHLGFEHGAALPINYQTALFALEHRALLRAGESLVVLGAAGGVGTAVIQVAKTLGAGTVVAVVSSAQKGEVACRAGADQAVLLEGEWWHQVRAATGGRGADIAYDPVGGDALLGGLRCLARFGRLLVIGFASGTIPEVRVNRLLLRNVSLVGAAWGEAVSQDPALGRTIARRLEGLLAGQTEVPLSPVIHQVLPLEGASEALALLESRQVRGKVVLRVRS